MNNREAIFLYQSDKKTSGGLGANDLYGVYPLSIERSLCCEKNGFVRKTKNGFVFAKPLQTSDKLKKVISSKCHNRYYKENDAVFQWVLKYIDVLSHMPNSSGRNKGDEMRYMLEQHILKSELDIFPSDSQFLQFLQSSFNTKSRKNLIKICEEYKNIYNDTRSAKENRMIILSHLLRYELSTLKVR